MPFTSAPLPERPPSLWRTTRLPATPRWVAILSLRLVLVALVALFLFGGWYLGKRGFGRQTRHLVVEELRKAGVEASIRKLTLDPFRGLVARDVRIFDYRRRASTIAIISEVTLDLNYSALLHGQPFLNALEVKDAELTLPPAENDPADAVPAQLRHFSARVYFPPERIDVIHAEGWLAGIRLTASGQLVKRDDYRPREADPAEWEQRLALARWLARELGRVRYSGAAPHLQVAFRGDIAAMEKAHITAALTCDQADFGGYAFRDFLARADWSEQRLTISALQWKDARGELVASGSWGPREERARLQLRSTADLAGALVAAGFRENLEKITVTGEQRLELAGSFSTATEKSGSLVGRLEVTNFSLEAVPFTALSADFSWDGRRTLLRDIEITQPTGTLRAQLLDAPGDFRLDLDGGISPVALLPLLSPGLQNFLKEWEWTGPPAVQMAIRGASRRPETWRGEGTLALPRTKFRGYWMNSATAQVRFAEGAVHYDDFRITRDEGVGTGSFVYDFARHEVRITGVESTLRPAEVIHWIEPKIAPDIEPYRFRQPPRVTVDGVVQFRGGKNTRLALSVNAPRGMDYTFLKRSLPFESVNGQLLFTDDRLQLVEVNGRLFGGNVRGTADISLARGDPRHTATVAVEGVDFPRLTDLYFGYKSSRGVLSGTYAFSGFGDDARQMRGQGEIKVVNGDVFAIPIFGPLSGLLSAIIPGSGYSIARQATASFTLADGVIHTDNVKIAGRLFSMLGRGDIHFLDDRLDFDMRLDASGLGIVLTPVYKFFEYKGEGPLANPRWHAKNF